MERSKHRRRGIRLTGVVATTICAGVMAAPASAKVAEYGALITHPDGDTSSISLKVKSRKNQETKKFRPFAIKKFSLNFLRVNCPDGVPTQTSFIYPDLIPVSGRKFSLSDTRGDTTFEANGRIPREGPIKGTFRIAFVKGGLDPQPCDSGTLSFTAKRLPFGTL